MATANPSATAAPMRLCLPPYESDFTPRYHSSRWTPISTTQSLQNRQSRCCLSSLRRKYHAITTKSWNTFMIFSRELSLARLRARIEAGVPIIGGGAGTGSSAKFEAAGGIDLIVIYNSGRYRMAGRGSLAGLMPYGDANAIVMEMAGEVLPVVTRTPVLAGVNGTDPFRDMDVFLDGLKALGFSGVQNFPTVGLIDGVFRANLEETGMSYALEIEMISKAHDKDMLTTPYVFSEPEAAA